ncbi:MULTISPECIES: energy-coupling factor transporter transmembrane component T [unclassified Granulicatella]|uniref:energy-coupling factor transporter transmembrane component T n=1 Tax=unclassified Granulicatella TaxID=2630493 RepID=UPI001072F2B6|nr:MULTISPECIES: energy-coupling factor transporter transmembrane component T [unclassified Granulicatella]MBF0780909.1 energy-coupling factor transporter transmembrane protein EcfT [Granulicatella sp. 19428wC4_WM01]TFU93224.1 energy-coupling factor transporter transmembrane protein EcfT [Granulicatella sp. WM01]
MAQKQLYSDAFSQLNPIVTMLFFVMSIVMTCLVLHPLSIVLSFSSAVCCLVWHQGLRALKKKCKILMPIFFIAAIINPLFSHAGATILWYFPSGNPLTLESILYGVYAGSMYVCIVLWFDYFHHIMTTDKFVYLFGKISPALSLLLSMSLRFVPRFIAQLKEIQKAQEMLGYSMHKGSIRRRVSVCIRILSILVTWALENGIDTADSMKARGYGVAKRTHFHIFTMTKRDKYSLLCLSMISIGCVIGLHMNQFHFSYFPIIQSKIHGKSIVFWIIYMFLLNAPILLNIQEKWLWRKSLILK